MLNESSWLISLNVWEQEKPRAILEPVLGLSATVNLFGQIDQSGKEAARPEKGKD